MRTWDDLQQQDTFVDRLVIRSDPAVNKIFWSADELLSIRAEKVQHGVGSPVSIATADSVPDAVEVGFLQDEITQATTKRTDSLAFSEVGGEFVEPIIWRAGGSVDNQVERRSVFRELHGRSILPRR